MEKSLMRDPLFSFCGREEIFHIGFRSLAQGSRCGVTVGKDEVRQHLAELGFVPGAEVSVVSELGGNLILSVKESRIALDKTMAMRIMV